VGFMKGVSPLVSSLILVLVVLGVGAYVVAYAIATLDRVKQEFSSSLAREVSEESHDLGILATYINGSTLYVLLATGDTPAVLQGVYVNGSEYTPMCLVEVNGVSKTVGSGLYVPSNSFIAIQCPLPPGSSCAVVRVVYDGGWVVGIARAIG